MVDDYFGIKVIDPYQWMENDNSPQFLSYMKAQNSYARAMLATIPHRKELLARIHQLSGSNKVVSQVTVAGDMVFYTMRTPASDNVKLYVRKGFHGPERLLFDPEKLTKNGVHTSIDYFQPSPDGRYVAYGASPGGSEASTLSIMDVAAGKDLPESITRADEANVSWRPDCRSFYYNRLKDIPNYTTAIDKSLDSAVYLHLLETPISTDLLVFSRLATPQIPMTAPESPYIAIPIFASKWALALVQNGVQNEQGIWVAPESSLTGGAANIPWKQVASYADDVTSVDASGDTLYLLTHKDTPRYRIVSVSLSDPDLAHATVVVPAGARVVRSLECAADALYVQDLDAGIGKLRRVDYASGAVSELALPFKGSVDGLSANGRKPGILFASESWTKPPLWYSYGAPWPHVTDTGLQPLSPVDYSKVTSEEVMAKSYDGTMIPLSIVHLKSMKLDGSNPTWLDAYGSYGISNDPYFSARMLAWFEQGGVYAVAHVRGGGEFGDDWYKAGYKQTKSNTWLDMIACAEYLIAHKITSPDHLAGEGGSAGGIAVGRAITTRPDLFAAALDDVGSSNTIRQELEPNGPPNIPEFGSFKDHDGFSWLAAMDTYQHVRDGLDYPGVLLNTGIHDPRVSSWELGKLAARLQVANDSGRPTLLRVDFDAGHGIGSTRAQIDSLLTDQCAFLFWQLGKPRFQPPGYVKPELPDGPS